MIRVQINLPYILTKVSTVEVSMIFDLRSSSVQSPS